MSSPDQLQPSDAAVVARYLQVRTLLHDRCLARVEALILERYDVQPTQRLPSTLTAQVRGGFVRPGEGEVWPVVFLTTVDVFVALCVADQPRARGRPWHPAQRPAAHAPPPLGRLVGLGNAPCRRPPAPL